MCDEAYKPHTESGKREVNGNSCSHLHPASPVRGVRPVGKALCHLEGMKKRQQVSENWLLLQSGGREGTKPETCSPGLLEGEGRPHAGPPHDISVKVFSVGSMVHWSFGGTLQSVNTTHSE